MFFKHLNHLYLWLLLFPGQKECDNAVRAIQSTRSLLENPNESINDMSYFECLETVMDKSKNLGDGMTGIANNAKKSEHEPFGEAVKDVANAITGLVESAAQAAFLVGVSEPSSAAGRSGLVDQAAFARASQVCCLPILIISLAKVPSLAWGYWLALLTCYQCPKINFLPFKKIEKK